MASAAPPTCTTTPTTIAGSIRSMPAATSHRICCCRSFRQAEADVMGLGERPEASGASVLHVFARRDVLAGLMFVGVALFGRWLSRDYPIGTALRMGTGYVPRLLCWILLGLGVVVLVQGLRDALASEASGQRGHSMVRAHSAWEDARERADH